MLDTFVNPQVHRVHRIDERLDTARKYARMPSMAHVGHDLAVIVRRDILQDKPHRIYTELPLRCHYEPVATVKAWRERIAVIQCIARLQKHAEPHASR